MQYYLWATRTSAHVSLPRLAGFSLINATVPAFQPLDERLAGRKTCKPPARTTRQPAAFCFRCPILLRTMREVCATTTAST